MPPISFLTREEEEGEKGGRGKREGRGKGKGDERGERGEEEERVWRREWGIGEETHF